MGVVITVVLLLRQSIEIAFLTIDFRVRPLLSLSLQAHEFGFSPYGTVALHIIAIETLFLLFPSLT